MTALKKLSLFAVLTVLALLPAGVANAQENLVTCTATNETPLIRREGIAELVQAGSNKLLCIIGRYAHRDRGNHYSS